MTDRARVPVLRMRDTTTGELFDWCRGDPVPQWSAETVEILDPAVRVAVERAREVARRLMWLAPSPLREALGPKQ